MRAVERIWGEFYRRGTVCDGGFAASRGGRGRGDLGEHWDVLGLGLGE